MLALCDVIFPGFDASYLSQRFPHLVQPVLHAVRRDDRLLGFKLAYRRGEAMLYSWLGGVHQELRGAGVARELMRRQHLWAEEQGFRTIETRTRASNVPMIILNLRSGFLITGYETDAGGVPIVTQRKSIAA